MDSFPELPDIVKQLLYDRGITTQEKIDEFMSPDYSKDVHNPFLFRDMKKAVMRLKNAVREKELIIVHGDYDADGVCASVILTTVLKELGGKTDIFIPHRETDGYGLNENTVRHLHSIGAKVIITCDCGISNKPEIDLAASMGIDTIITDHHQEPKELPNAFAIIHPKIAAETYPDKTLAGGGVAFKLAQAMLKEYGNDNAQLPSGAAPQGFTKWLLDMVAISSVADMVPLLGETRTLVKYGIVVMEKLRRPGLKKIIQTAGLTNGAGAIKNTRITTQDIAFRIAPRINAAGRMNHANVAFKLLISQDKDEVERLGNELQNSNTERQQLTEQLVNSAKEIIEKSGDADKPMIFVLGLGWSTGIIGLIASKLKDIYGKPVIAMGENNGQITGSGRSLGAFNMISALQDMPQYFKKFGGHPQACGFSLVGREVLEEFKNAMIMKAGVALQNIDLTPSINIDMEVNLDDINWELSEILEKFQPFGVGNPEPRYVARSLTIHNVEQVGSDGKHIRMHVTHTNDVVRKTIGFYCTELCENLKQGDKIDLVFEVGINEWNGTRELQLKIIDLKRL